ncbi:putative nucleotidyltransferase, ribonuclease H, partial [Tanacetum coccineum]
MDSPPNHEWEQAFDIDDSDLRLTPAVRPSNNPHILPETTTTTQTLLSSQNHQVDNYVVKPIRIIPGSADANKFLKHKKLDKVVAIIKSCTPNALGDLTVSLKDLSGTISDTIHYKVLTEE